MAVNSMPISDLRRKTNAIIQIAQDQDEPVYITLHGRPAVVTIVRVRHRRDVHR